MRHAQADSLIERYVDGALEESLAEAVLAHARGCDRCSRRIAEARDLAAVLSAEPAGRAPRGFAEKVMDAVYREALRGAPGPAASAVELAPAEPAPAAPRRVYRRLGLSFVLTAAVLTASLLIPFAAYPTLFRPHGAAGAGGALVKGMIVGAGLTVRGALHPAGDGAYASPGGSPR